MPVAHTPTHAVRSSIYCTQFYIGRGVSTWYIHVIVPLYHTKYEGEAPRGFSPKRLYVQDLLAPKIRQALGGVWWD